MVWVYIICLTLLLGSSLPASQATSPNVVNFNFANMFSGTGCCGGNNNGPCNQPTPTYSACVDDNGPNNATYSQSLFENLSVEEIDSVVAFLLADGGLGLAAYGDAAIDSNYIYLVETLVPPKQEVLSFLDASGANPGRYARAILYNGAKATPDVTEVKVGPLPVGPSTTIVPINNLGAIPFSSRSPDDIEYTLMDEFVVNVCEEIDELMLESFNAHYFNCTDDCLEWSDSAPRGPTRDRRATWLWFMYIVDGKYMHHTGLEMKINHFGTDVAQWKLEKIVYNGVGFNTTAELLAAYADGSVAKITPAAPEELARSSFARKSNGAGKERGAGQNRKPPRHYEPEGKRYSVTGSHVEYMGWDIDVSLRASAGLGLWNVRFLGERIAYEISLQEATATYSSSQPSQSLSTYLDASWGMGWSSYELKAGIDCPAHATFLDVVQYVEGTATTFKNAICVFEQDLAIPIGRHVSNLEAFDSYVGASSYVLVVRTVSTVYNYDYIYDYIFYLNGVIEVKVSTSGYFQGTWYSPDDKATMRATATTGGSLHDHLLNYKVDLDIAGTSNRFMKRNIETEVVQFPWHDFPHYQKKLVDHVLQDETEGGIVYDFDAPALYTVINHNEHNGVGNPRGYRIAIKDNAKNLLQATPLHKGLQWSKYQIAVTKHKDTEPHSSVMYNQATLAEPVLEFDSFFDGDNLVDEDIVAWVTMGVFHMVHAEDIPMTFTPGNYASFFLKPNNFFDQDPSVDLKHAVIIKAGESADAAGKVYEYDETSVTQCAPKTTGPTFDGYQH